MRGMIAVVLVGLLLSGCGVNKARIAQQAEGPKDLYVNLSSDPLLLSIELRAGLEARGYQVALNTEEVRRSAVVDREDGKTIYHNATDSPHRYELSIAYQPIQDRIQLISAAVRDRETGTIMGAYRWSWARLIPAPTIDGAIEMIDENLLTPVFRE